MTDDKCFDTDQDNSFIVDIDNNSESFPGISKDKERNFRQRRLSYTSHQMKSAMDQVKIEEKRTEEEQVQENGTAPSSSVYEEINEDSSLFLKKRRQENESNHPSESIVSSPNVKRSCTGTKILHASFPPEPTCPKLKASKIYMLPPRDSLQRNDPNKEIDNWEVSAEELKEQEWKKQYRVSHEHPCDKLPFPRNAVGIYSCHGMEPIYEPDYHAFAKDLVHESESYTMAKINQDRGGIAFPFASSDRTALFGTYDGHGECGDLVAQYCLHQIPIRLEQHEAFKRGDFKTAITEVFLEVDSDLNNQSEIEPLFSGCTAVVALVRKGEVFLANAGDSRAVLACKDPIQEGKHKAVDLTVDQNPNSPGEQERIEKMGGFVSPPPEEGLSARVWLDAGFTQIGLAMSRSLGDYAVKPVGVIAEPVVSHRKLQNDDDFLIIATDGVWEFLSSQDAVDIVSSQISKGASYACQRLIEAAAEKWHEYEGDYRDDITALVIRLKELWCN